MKIIANGGGNDAIDNKCAQCREEEENCDGDNAVERQSSPVVEESRSTSCNDNENKDGGGNDDDFDHPAKRMREGIAIGFGVGICIGISIAAPIEEGPLAP